MVLNRINGYHPDGKALEVDWPCHRPRSVHHLDVSILEATRKAKKGPPKDRMAADSRKGNEADGKDLERQGLADVEGLCCGSTPYKAKWACVRI